jgi:hypothetical protein
MASVMRQRAPKKKREWPTLQPEIAYLWDWWQSLHASRSAGGFGANPITYSDIEVFARVMRERIEPWEARAIRAVDDAWLASNATPKDEGTGNG